MNERNEDDQYSSKIEVGSLINADKINLVAVVLDNLDLFHRHHNNTTKYVTDRRKPSNQKENEEPKVNSFYDFHLNILYIGYYLLNC